MYVCLCNAHREADLRKAVADGADTVERAYSMLGRGPRRGCCIPAARALVEGAGDARPGHERVR